MNPVEPGTPGGQMAMARSKQSEITDLPQGAKVYSVNVEGVPYTVAEFPFSYFKKFRGFKLAKYRGAFWARDHLVILDSEIKASEKRWTLKHELTHALRSETHMEHPAQLWDELETELWVLAKTELTDLEYSKNKEVMEALQVYMKSNPDVVGQARRLVEFLKEGVDESKKAGPEGAAGLPKDTVQRRIRR